MGLGGLCGVLGGSWGGFGGSGGLGGGFGGVLGGFGGAEKVVSRYDWIVGGLGESCSKLWNGPWRTPMPISQVHELPLEKLFLILVKGSSL